MKNVKEFNTLQATFKRLLQFLSFIAFRSVYLNKFDNLSLTDDDIKKLCQLIGRAAVTQQINSWYGNYKRFVKSESSDSPETVEETPKETVEETPKETKKSSKSSKK